MVVELQQKEQTRKRPEVRSALAGVPVVEKNPDGSLKRFEGAPMINPEVIRMTANLIADQVDLQPNDQVGLHFNHLNLQLTEALVQEVTKRTGALPFMLPLEQRIFAAQTKGRREFTEKHPGESPVEFANQAAIPETVALATADKAIAIRALEQPDIMDGVDAKTYKKIMEGRNNAMRIRTDDRKWTLFYMPTEAEAAFMGMSYEDWAQMSFEAAFMPWPEVAKAQEKLVDIMNNAQSVEIYGQALNPDEKDPSKRQWQTHISMAVGDDKDNMTFVNSTVGANVPGSEVYSAPIRGTVNGVIVIDYPLMFNGKLIKGIAVAFKDGKVTRAETPDASDNELLQATIAKASELGEIAFGTNRALIENVERLGINPPPSIMYAEKLGGSIHMALGDSYADHDGAHTYNGFSTGTNDHHDIVRTLTEKTGGGIVVVGNPDGSRQIVQYNGVFVKDVGGQLVPDEDLAILSAPYDEAKFPVKTADVLAMANEPYIAPLSGRRTDAE